MKHGWKIAVCLAGGLVLNASLRADDAALTANPYALIVTRNIFGLNPPPPPVDPNAAPAEPAVKITPNGILSVMGQSQVLFKTSGGGKPGEQSYILSEGQAEDEIEVVKIDEKDGIVTFNNHGLVQELPLANSTSNSTAKTTGRPVTVFNPPTGFPAAGGGNNGANAFPLPAGFGGGQGVANNGFSPQFGVTTPAASTATQQQAPMDPDVQKVLIVANHLKAIQDGDPTAQIYPITDADGEAGVPSNEATPSTPTGSTPAPTP